MNENYFENMLNQVDFSIAEHELIYDDKGNPVDYRYCYVNQSFCDLLGKTKEEMIGHLAYVIFPNLEKTYLKKYADIVKTGESLMFTDYTKEMDTYFNIYAYKSGEHQFVTSFKDVSTYVRSMRMDQQVDMIANLFETSKSAYFEFNLREKKFEYSELLPDIIGMEIITYQDYVNLFSIHIHPLDQNRFSKQINRVFSGELNEIGMQVRFLHQQTKKYVWISFFSFVDARYRGFPTRLRGLIKDIDAEKRKESEQEHRERLFAETRKIANIATFYFYIDKNEFQVSTELDAFTGIEHLVTLEQFRRIVHPEDLETYDFSTREIINNRDGMVTNYRIIKGEDIRYIQSSIFAEANEESGMSGVFGILKDVTLEEESKQEIEYFANHDVLTGLYNRNNFEVFSKKLEQEKGLALMICDVDGLKLINDAFGHLEGDKLLVHLADILVENTSIEDVYRIGGDEFVITIHDADEGIIAHIEQSIKQSVKRFRVFGVGFDVSIGYSYLDEKNSFEEAFRTAENVMYRRKLTERKSRKSTALGTIMETMHEKTEETEDHCRRVGSYASELLRVVGRKRDYEIEEIRLISDVHDIGKISISDYILSKTESLTKEEYNAIKYHSESGYKIISNIIENEDIAIAVLYHHEKYDGSGYPHGLVGEDIPLYSRIIAICDAYDAMTTDRVYRKAMTKKHAVKELEKNKDTQFDPHLVDLFVKILKKW